MSTCAEYIKDKPYEYICSYEALTRVVNKLGNSEFIGTDFETSGLDQFVDRTWLLSLTGEDSELTYLIDTQRASKSGVWNNDKDLLPLKELLESKVLLGAEFKFDLKWLRTFNIRPRRVFDVVVVGRLLTLGLREHNSLSAQCERYLGFPLDKEVRSSFVNHPDVVARMAHPPVWTEEQKQYACVDAIVLHEIRKAQIARLAEEGLRRTSVVENKVVPVTADLEYDGVYVDKGKWITCVKKAEAKRKQLYGELCNLLVTDTSNTQLSLLAEETGSDYVLNVGSLPEMHKRFHDIGLDLDNLDKKTLAGISHPAAAKRIEYQEQEKLVSTYGYDWIGKIHPATGRIHSSFNQMVDTGRYSSKNPNTQNVTNYAGFRDCFVAPEGCDLIIADYAQAEMCILAEMSQDKEMIRAIKAGGDLHAQTASLIFDVPIEQCGKKSQKRTAAKAINFAVIYGLGDRSLAEKLGYPLKYYEEEYTKWLHNQIMRAEMLQSHPQHSRVAELKSMSDDELRTVLIASYAEIDSMWKLAWNKALKQTADIRREYFKRFCGVKKWCDWAEQQPFTVGYSTTLLGRRRHYAPMSEYLSEDERGKAESGLKNRGKNSPIQGGNVDITKIAMVLIANDILTYNYPARLVNCVHDETVTECRKDMTPVVAEIVERRMVEAGKVLLKTVPLGVDVTISDHWTKE